MTNKTTTRYLQHDGGRIAYDLRGHGPLVVCVPSMGDVRAEYRLLAPQLAAAGYTVATLDVRGHGESSTEWDDLSVDGVGRDIVALVRSLDAGPACIVGESMAAGAAIWAAAEAPAAIAALILIGPFVRGEGSALMNALYAVLFARPWGPAVWQWYYGTLYPTRKPEDFAAYAAALRANLAERGRLEALRKMLAASKAASEQRMGKVTQPLLVVMGTKDPDFKDPAGEAQWVAETLRGTLHLVEGAGHYPHVEMPEITSPLIVDFLRQYAPVAEDVYAA